ncbi:MAG: hypothetical protein ACI8ZN_002712 [Bacteroidia bacterium]|jgi:hypothetical protein
MNKYLACMLCALTLAYSAQAQTRFAIQGGLGHISETGFNIHLNTSFSIEFSPK